MAFDWFGHPKSKIGWVPPYSSWRENFRLSKREKKNMLLTRQEEIAFEQPKPVYELDQLKELYRVALPRTRLYMLMGVCLGWTQKQISILTRSEMKIINGEMSLKPVFDAAFPPGRKASGQLITEPSLAVA